MRHVFPSVDAPEGVAPKARFALTVALTEEQETPEAKIVQGQSDAAGRMPVPFAEGEQEIEIQAILSAPGFEIAEGKNTETLSLPRAGSSAPVKFELAALPLAEGTASLARPVFVTLWRNGAFLAKVRRAITVRAGAEAPVAAKSPDTEKTRHEPDLDVASFATASRTPDLTVLLLRNPDPGLREDSLVVVNGPALQPMQGRYPTPRGLPEWLGSQYRRFAGLRARGARPVAQTAEPERPDASNFERLRDRTALIEGFGETLWERFAPEVFRTAFWQLYDSDPERVLSILVLTDDPSLPWELMQPVRRQMKSIGRGFPPRLVVTDRLHLLGVQARIGRWHMDAGGVARPRPPIEQPWAGLRAIAPSYQSAMALPAQSSELSALGAVPEMVRTSGRLADVRRTLGDSSGLVHFAGHGTVEQSGHAAEYTLVLEDGRLDVMTWRGIEHHPKPGAAPIYFFNACDVGEADAAAGFVDGWAPAVLESGAAGFIGGLWPLGDGAAADFAARFYAPIAAALHELHGAIEIAELLRVARRGFYETGDPTYLAYVFYGDPLLRLVPAAHATSNRGTPARPRKVRHPVPPR